MRREQQRAKSKRLMDILEDVLDDENDEAPCMVCTL